MGNLSDMVLDEIHALAETAVEHEGSGDHDFADGYMFAAEAKYAVYLKEVHYFDVD